MSYSSILLYFQTTTPTPTPTVPSVNLAAILYGYRAMLVNAGVFSPNQCLVGLYGVQEQPFPISGSAFAVLTPGGYNEIEGQVSGGGRYVSGQGGTFTVHVIVRNRMDMAYHEEAFLMHSDPDAGVFSSISKVINVLHMEFVYNVNNEILTEEPVRLVRIGQPRRYGKDGGWGGIPLEFQTKYLYNINVP